MFHPPDCFAILLSFVAARPPVAARRAITASLRTELTASNKPFWCWSESPPAKEGDVDGRQNGWRKLRDAGDHRAARISRSDRVRRNRARDDLRN